MTKIELIQGDTLSVLKTLESESVDMCITSPPYFGLRVYLKKDHPDYNKQIGLEPTFQEFQDKLLAVIFEIKRVLKKSGSFWLNCGDCFGGNPTGSMPNPNASFRSLRTQSAQMESQEARKITRSVKGFEKCMLMMPERLAIKMIDGQGWILRNKIKWAKQVLIKGDNKTIGSVMPTSVKDRFNESGEELYFFVKNKRYYFNLNAVRIPNQVVGITDMRDNGVLRQKLYRESKYNKFNYQPNKMSSIPGQSIQGIERERAKKKSEQCPQFKATDEEIKNYAPADHRGKNDTTEKNYGLKKYQGKFAGHPNAEMFNSPRAGTQRITDNGPKSKIDTGDRRLRYPIRYENEDGKNLPTIWQINPEPHNFQNELGVECDHFATFPEALIEIPILAGCPPGGIVLDPFSGAATTGVVAKKLGRSYLGIEINAEYIEMSRRRLAKIPESLF